MYDTGGRTDAYSSSGVAVMTIRASRMGLPSLVCEMTLGAGGGKALTWVNEPQMVALAPRNINIRVMAISLSTRPRQPV